MGEIEVKARVKELESIVKKLEGLGCQISQPVRQEDVIFDKPDFGPEGRNILRIRKSDNQILFTLKRDRANELDCIEEEVVVSDVDSLRTILELLGFKEIIQVKKSRRKCHYKEYEICLDEVEGLGSFIEVEKISDQDGEKVQDELFQFLESLGIEREDRVLQGYDTLLQSKNSGM